MSNKITKLNLLGTDFDILPYIKEYTTGERYPIDATVVKDRAIYRAISDIASAPATFDSNDWEQIGGGSLFTNNNLTPSADTFAGWKALFANTTTTGAANTTGYFITWYNTAGKFDNQPSTYGFLETFLIGNDMYQRWHTQTSGPILWRSANGSGWSPADKADGSWSSTYINRLTDEEIDDIWDEVESS